MESTNNAVKTQLIYGSNMEMSISWQQIQPKIEINWSAMKLGTIYEIENWRSALSTFKNSCLIAVINLATVHISCLDFGKEGTSSQWARSNKGSISCIPLQSNVNLGQKSFVTQRYDFPCTFNSRHKHFYFISESNLRSKLFWSFPPNFRCFLEAKGTFGPLMESQQF